MGDLAQTPESTVRSLTSFRTKRTDIMYIIGDLHGESRLGGKAFPSTHDVHHRLRASGVPQMV